MNPLSIGLVTDLHYARREPIGDRHCRDSLAKLGEAVDCFVAAPVDLVANLGDLIDIDTDTAADATNVAALMAQLRRFHGRRCHVLGNHDVTTFSKHEFIAHLDDGVPGPYCSFDHGGWHVVVLDGNHHADGTDYCRGDFSWDDAWLGDAQLDWLAADLAATTLPTVVLCHENLDDRGAPDPHVVGDAARARRILADSGRVKAILQGHCHPGGCGAIGDIPCITLRAMVTGPYPAGNAYAIATLDATGIRVRGFGCQPAYD